LHCINSLHQLNAVVNLPPSKSISARLLILNALTDNPIKLMNISDCDDTMALTRALSIRHSIVDIGAAGTAMRFLAAYFAIQSDCDIILTGSERMKNRPIKILAEALKQLGSDIEYIEKEGFPPLHIKGHTLKGGEIKLDGNVSSQYISALLMISPLMTNGLTLHLNGKIISQPYINLTLSLMKQFGIKISTPNEQASSSERSLILTNKKKHKNFILKIHPQSFLPPSSFTIESDWSAASYWYEIVALSNYHDTKIVLNGLQQDTLQGDAGIVGLFNCLGVNTEFNADSITLTKKTLSISGLYSLNFDFINMPDIAQTAVVTCCMLGISFRFSGLQSLRIKETDRIQALTKELFKLGYRLETEVDSVLTWNGLISDVEKDPVIETYKDHRMAMAFAPIALRNKHGIKIADPDVVSKSYTNFWKDLENAGFKIYNINN